MLLSLRQLLSVVLMTALAAVPSLAQPADDGDHLVSRPDLHRAARGAVQARQDSVAQIEKFLLTGPARQAMSALHVDSGQVTHKLSSLTDDELARLAAQSEKIQSDIAAGDVTKKTLLKYVIVGAAAVVVIALVLTHNVT
jgi:hypothetical protein